MSKCQIVLKATRGTPSQALPPPPPSRERGGRNLRPQDHSHVPHPHYTARYLGLGRTSRGDQEFPHAASPSAQGAKHRHSHVHRDQPSVTSVPPPAPDRAASPQPQLFLGEVSAPTPTLSSSLLPSVAPRTSGEVESLTGPELPTSLCLLVLCPMPRNPQRTGLACLEQDI